MFTFKHFIYIYLESWGRLSDTGKPGNLSLINRTHCISHAEWTVSKTMHTGPELSFFSRKFKESLINLNQNVCKIFLKIVLFVLVYALSISLLTSVNILILKEGKSISI